MKEKKEWNGPGPIRHDAAYPIPIFQTKEERYVREGTRFATNKRFFFCDSKKEKKGGGHILSCMYLFVNTKQVKKTGPSVGLQSSEYIGHSCFFVFLSSLCSENRRLTVFFANLITGIVWSPSPRPSSYFLVCPLSSCHENASFFSDKTINTNFLFPLSSSLPLLHPHFSPYSIPSHPPPPQTHSPSLFSMHSLSP